jgi:hypothetical protein
VSALHHLAAATRAAGRGPDRHLVHLSDRELQLLHRSWGPPDVNPRTGLPEYGWFDDVLGAILPIAGAAFPGVGSDIGSFLGAGGEWAPVLGNAILGGGAGLLTSGGDWKKGLLGAGIGGLSAAAMPYLANALGGTDIGNMLGITGGYNTLTGKPDQGAFASQYFGGDTGSRIDSYTSDPAFSSSTAGNLARAASGSVGTGGTTGGGGSGGSSWLKAILPAVTLAGMLTSGKGQQGQPQTAQNTGSSGGGGALPKLTVDMRPKDMSNIDWWTFGQRPKTSTSFFDPITRNPDGSTYGAAHGGYIPGYAGGGDVVKGLAKLARSAKEPPEGFRTMFEDMTGIFNPPKEDLLSAYLELKRPTPDNHYFESSVLRRLLQDAPGVRSGDFPIDEYLTQLQWGMKDHGYASGGPIPGGALSALAGAGQGSRYVGPGPGSGRDDQIRARLSPNEYVVDAETVSMLGDGSPDEGARRLDKMRKGVRQHKGRALAKGKFSPNAKAPERYLGGRV